MKIRPKIYRKAKFPKNKSVRNYDDLKELRECIVNFLHEKKINIRSQSTFTDQYVIQLKSWCVTLFMVSTGFCLRERESLGYVYYFLPVVPVLLFWFLHAYKEYRIEFYLNHPDSERIDEYLSNLFDYSYDELHNLLKEITSIKFDWPHKGSFKPDRFFREKLKGIVSKFFCHLENLTFFGGMILFWFFILIIQNVDLFQWKNLLIHLKQILIP